MVGRMQGVEVSGNVWGVCRHEKGGWGATLVAASAGQSQAAGAERAQAGADWCALSRPRSQPEAGGRTTCRSAVQRSAAGSQVRQAHLLGLRDLLDEDEDGVHDGLHHSAHSRLSALEGSCTGAGGCSRPSKAPGTLLACKCIW